MVDRNTASDHDASLMIAGNWMDSSAPNVERQNIFRSPAVPAPSYGITDNSAIAGGSSHRLPHHYP